MQNASICSTFLVRQVTLFQTTVIHTIQKHNSFEKMKRVEMSGVKVMGGAVMPCWSS